MEFSNFKSQVLDEISNEMGLYSENKENIQSESEQKFEKKISLDNTNFDSKNNNEIIRNNSFLSMDVSKLQINIQELKSQIKLLEEENYQKQEQIQNLLEQQFQDKELINLVLSKNKILEKQDENRLKDFEKELVSFLAEQEIQMKNIFKDEITKMCEVQEQMQQKIDLLECEKMQIVKLNQRLLKNENQQQEQRKHHFSISQEEQDNNIKYQTDRELAIKKGKQYDRSLDCNKRNVNLLEKQENHLNSIKFENSKSHSIKVNEVCSTKNSYYLDQNRKKNEEYVSLRQNTEQTENVNKKNQNMINELLKIYQVQDENQIIQCALKTEKVMKTVPKLEFMLSQICSLILGKNKNQLDMLMPALTEMVNKINFGHKIYSEHAYTCKVFAIGDEENFFNSIQMIKQAIDEYLDFLIKIKKFLNVSPEEYNLTCLQKIWQILQQNQDIQQQQYQIYE